MRDFDQKPYFTVRSLMEAAVALAKTDPRYEAAAKECPLDYEIVIPTTANKELKISSFDVISQVVYGGAEGIYAGIQVLGYWSPEQGNDPTHKGRMSMYTMKTLDTNKDAYLGMGAMANLITYYANQIARENPGRFD